MAEPIKCLNGFHVYAEQDWPDYRKNVLYRPIYEAVTHLWRNKEQIAVAVPLGAMDPGTAQKKAHQWAERHKFSIDSRKDKSRVWFRRSQKVKDVAKV